MTAISRASDDRTQRLRGGYRVLRVAARLLMAIIVITVLAFADRALAQGVPVIDGSRLANAISRLQEQVRDATNQSTKITDRNSLTKLEDDQRKAYERFLADTTGSYRTGFVVLSFLALGGVVFFTLAKPPSPPVRDQPA